MEDYIKRIGKEENIIELSEYGIIDNIQNLCEIKGLMEKF
jgi:hypothetical protein